MGLAIEVAMSHEAPTEHSFGQAKAARLRAPASYLVRTS